MTVPSTQGAMHRPPLAVDQFDAPGPISITPTRFGDARGYFAEVWNRQRFEAAGIPGGFVQDNQSVSVAQRVLRGLHFQAPPHAQGKLVRVSRGSVLDVFVDIRRGASSFGRWCAVELNAENGMQVYIPPGFLHGFVTRMPNTEVLYKCTEYYAPDAEGCIRFDDPQIGIDWGISHVDAILSEKDRAGAAFSGFVSPFEYDRGSA